MKEQGKPKKKPRWLKYYSHPCNFKLKNLIKYIITTPFFMLIFFFFFKKKDNSFSQTSTFLLKYNKN